MSLADWRCLRLSAEVAKSSPELQRLSAAAAICGDPLPFLSTRRQCLGVVEIAYSLALQLLSTSAAAQRNGNVGAAVFVSV